MPDRHILAGVQQALAAIDVMLRNGRMQQGQLVALAQEARRSAEIAQQRLAEGPAPASASPSSLASPSSAAAAPGAVMAKSV